MKIQREQEPKKLYYDERVKFDGEFNENQIMWSHWRCDEVRNSNWMWKLIKIRMGMAFQPECWLWSHFLSKSKNEIEKVFGVRRVIPPAINCTRLCFYSTAHRKKTFFFQFFFFFLPSFYSYSLFEPCMLKLYHRSTYIATSLHMFIQYSKYPYFVEHANDEWISSKSCF